jgi:hypothetical protein
VQDETPTAIRDADLLSIEEGLYGVEAIHPDLTSFVEAAVTLLSYVQTKLDDYETETDRLVATLDRAVYLRR